MDPEQNWTYFTPGLSFPWTRLLLLRENTSLESVVPQARRTQGRLKIWLPRWDVHDRGARVLQAGTLMLVHTDHWALDPPAYLQHAKEKNCILPPVMFNGTPVGNLVDGYSWKENSVSQFLFQVLISSKWVSSNRSLLKVCVFFGGSFHLTESVSPSGDDWGNGTSSQVVMKILQCRVQ